VETLEDPAWGPAEDLIPGGGHALANGVCDGYASVDGVYLAAGRIDALATCEGHVLRTAQVEHTRAGIAQVRRRVEGGPLALVHLVFAPIEPRPILLGLARLQNRSSEPLVVDYTEIWDVDGGDFRASEGACERRTAEGVCVLADVSMVVRARVPRPPPRNGLALDLRVALPPEGTRNLSFAYATPDADDSAAWLVRAWRGGVATSLTRTVHAWLKRIGPSDSPVEAYRRLAGGAPRTR
jgi:hypothetical protein